MNSGLGRRLCFYCEEANNSHTMRDIFHTWMEEASNQWGCTRLEENENESMSDSEMWGDICEGVSEVFGKVGPDLEEVSGTFRSKKPKWKRKYR